MKFLETARRMKVALDRANMTQQELSEKSGVSKSSISHYINGNHSPSNISSNAMAEVLGVNPLWLMGFDVDMDISWTPYTQEIESEEENTSYYTDDRSRDIAEFLHKNPDYAVLFDATRKVKPEDIARALKAIGIFIDDDEE